jgi:hypothetical protein
VNFVTKNRRQQIQTNKNTQNHDFLHFRGFRQRRSQKHEIQGRGSRGKQKTRNSKEDNPDVDSSCSAATLEWNATRADTMWTEPTANQEKGFDFKDSYLYEFIQILNDKMPSRRKIKWLENMKGFWERVSVEGLVFVGTGCSGTDIMLHGLEGLRLYWQGEHELSVQKIVHSLAAEKDPPRQQFIDEQHHPELLLDDVAKFEDTKVCDARNGRATVLPGVPIFGAGFVCKNLSKQNNSRSSSKGCVRNKSGETGTTYNHVRNYIVRFRPRVSFLENVAEIQQTYELDDGVTSSDKDYIVEDFQSQGFTVIFVDFNCTEYGSPKECRRAWFLILDIPREIADVLGVEEAFFAVFDSLLVEKEIRPPVTRFLLDGAMHEKFMGFKNSSSAKRVKANLEWKLTHERLFSEIGLTWPPDVAHLTAKGFRIREAEVAYLADHMFHGCGIGWQFFDANHSAERTFRLDKAPETLDQNVLDRMRVPWQSTVPTLTAQSVIVARYTHPGGPEPFTELRRLHPIELFRLNLWDVDMWATPPHEHGDITTELLCDMAGNSWSLFAFVPLAVALLGCVPWSKAEALVAVAIAARSSSSEAAAMTMMMKPGGLLVSSSGSGSDDDGDDSSHSD